MHSANATASLQYSNSDVATYALCTQRLPLVVPGRSYAFGALVKTLDVIGEDSGATLCLQWGNVDGTYGGGSYPDGVKGTTTSWAAVGGITAIPADAEAGSVTVTVYLRRGNTGQAWFDGIYVQERPPRPMRTVLMSPLYRGRITGSYPHKIVVRAHLTPYPATSSQLDMTVRAQLATANGSVVETVVQAGNQSVVDLLFDTPPQALAAGGYNVTVVCSNATTGAPLATTWHALQRVPDSQPPPLAFIDGKQRLVLRGKTHFPIGLYTSGINEDDLRNISGTAFNTIMPYGECDRVGMDLAHRYNVSIVFSVKDDYLGSRFCPKAITTLAQEEAYVRARFRAFRDHPALLAWYLNDELGPSWVPRLAAHQAWAEVDDPDHPTWVVLYEVGEINEYLETFDVIGSDPYPWDSPGHGSTAGVTSWVNETVQQTDGARPVWEVVQAMNHQDYQPCTPACTTPSYAAQRSMAWQAICGGAQGLFMYSFFDMKKAVDVSFATQWAIAQRVAAEISSFVPILLSDKARLPMVTGAGDNGTAWLRLRAHRTDNLQHQLLNNQRHQQQISADTYVLFAVSTGSGNGTVTFDLTDVWPTGILRVDVLTEPQRRVPVVGNTSFIDTIATLQMTAYQVVLHPSKLVSA